MPNLSVERNLINFSLKTCFKLIFLLVGCCFFLQLDGTPLPPAPNPPAWREKRTGAESFFYPQENSGKFKKIIFNTINRLMKHNNLSYQFLRSGKDFWGGNERKRFLEPKHFLYPCLKGKRVIVIYFGHSRSFMKYILKHHCKTLLSLM